MIRTGTRLLCLLALGIVGCGDPLASLGVQERVIETRTQQTSDDVLSDKHPQYDPGRTITEQFEHCEFTLNKSASVTRLTFQPLGSEDRDLDGVLFPTRAEALRQLGERRVVASMEVVNGMLKPFNDGLYAAVELLAEQGQAGALVNKRSVFDAVLEGLLQAHELDPEQSGVLSAATDFAAAAELGGFQDSDLPSDVQSAKTERLADFAADPFYAQPIGFYTWLPELETIGYDLDVADNDRPRSVARNAQIRKHWSRSPSQLPRILCSFRSMARTVRPNLSANSLFR